ncbi:MAG: hypothetical protein ACD_42C00185G0003 [uncultured bacterium]|nr:MAG: hypothetical protein ACD_42C00185G0003 [uncultured bacterium]
MRFFLIIFSVFCMVSSACNAAPKHIINLPKPNLPFSDGIVIGNTLYISGEDGIASDGKLVTGGIIPETNMAISKIRKIVHAAGFQMRDVVKTTVYMSNLNDYQKMNVIYRHAFLKSLPTRSTIQVARLVGSAHIEISAIAVK